MLDGIGNVLPVSNARRIGTIAAFELDSASSNYLSDVAPRAIAFGREQGVLIRPLGNTFYVMPPYCIDEADLGSIYEAVIGFAGTSGLHR